MRRHHPDGRRKPREDFLPIINTALTQLLGIEHPRFCQPLCHSWRRWAWVRHDLAAIRDVLAAYDHTDAMAAVALTPPRARLDGRTPHDPAAAEPAPVGRHGADRIAQAARPDRHANRTAAPVTGLNGLGTRRPAAVLASRYRHLAHWPPYLSFA